MEKETSVTPTPAATAASNGPRIKGVIIDYNHKTGLGKILADDEFFFFHKHHMLRGFPKEGANVTFLVSPKPVQEGFLKYAILINIVVDTETGAAILAQPVDGQKADAQETK
jgi:hypothetical protein